MQVGVFDLLMFHSRSFHLPTRSAFQAACCRPCVPVGPLSVASWQLAANACTVAGTAHVLAEKGEGREGKEGGREMMLVASSTVLSFPLFFRIALCNSYYAAMPSKLLSNSTKGSMEMGCRQQSVAALSAYVCVCVHAPDSRDMCAEAAGAPTSWQQCLDPRHTAVAPCLLPSPFSCLFSFALYSILIYCFLLLLCFLSTCPICHSLLATCHFLR